MSMKLHANLHEIVRKNGVVCEAIALLLLGEQCARVAAHAAFVGCINPMCGAHSPCCCHATSVTTAGRGP